MTAGPGRGHPADLDRSIARLLTFGTYVSVALLAVGVVFMFLTKTEPLVGGPPLQLDIIVDDILHLRPAGFIWLGLVAVVGTPAARVIAALVGFIRRGERTMAIVATCILLVIALSVALARGLEG